MSAFSTRSTDGRPVALVTGASRGIGRAVATVLARRGHLVLGTSRAPDRLRPEERVPGIEYLPLDLESEDSARACAARAGPVDVLVNNAGQSQLAPAEHVSRDAARRLFETNVLGPIALTRLLLPAMRERGSGTVIMIGSLAAEFPVPFQSTYAATKGALQAFVQAIRAEVRPFGIHVVLVQPGDVRTEIQERLERILPKGSPYADAVATMSANARRAVDSAGNPSAVAERVWKVVSNSHPAPVYSVGAEGLALTCAKRFIPRRGVERLVARRYGI
jgi:short-subunit dehydrogenase